MSKHAPSTAPQPQTAATAAGPGHNVSETDRLMAKAWEQKQAKLAQKSVDPFEELERFLSDPPLDLKHVTDPKERGRAVLR